MPDNLSTGIICDLQSPIKTISLRLLPGADVRRGLENLAEAEQISAAVILVSRICRVSPEFATGVSTMP